MIDALGYLGFAVTAIDNFQVAALDPMRAAEFARAGLMTRTIIEVTNPVISSDPREARADRAALRGRPRPLDDGSRLPIT